MDIFIKNNKNKTKIKLKKIEKIKIISKLLEDLFRKEEEILSDLNNTKND